MPLTPTALSRLTDLHGQGRTVGEIAADLGLPRAIIARAHRLAGLTPHPEGPTMHRNQWCSFRVSWHEADRIAAAGGGAWVRELVLAALDQDLDPR